MFTIAPFFSVRYRCILISSDDTSVHIECCPGYDEKISEFMEIKYKKSVIIDRNDLSEDEFKQKFNEKYPNVHLPEEIMQNTILNPKPIKPIKQDQHTISNNEKQSDIVIDKNILEKYTIDELQKEINRRKERLPLNGKLTIQENMQVNFEIDDLFWKPGIYNIEIRKVNN